MIMEILKWLYIEQHCPSDAYTKIQALRLEADYEVIPFIDAAYGVVARSYNQQEVTRDAA